MRTGLLVPSTADDGNDGNENKRGELRYFWSLEAHVARNIAAAVAEAAEIVAAAADDTSTTTTTTTE